MEKPNEPSNMDEELQSLLVSYDTEVIEQVRRGDAEVAAGLIEWYEV